MTSGTAAYVVQGDDSSNALQTEVKQGTFFCEAALWCKWKHVGELTALSACELLSISSSGLIKCLEGEEVVKHVVMQYGRNFHARLVAPLSPDSERPNDIIVAFTEFDAILPSLPAQCRRLIGAVAVSVVKERRGKMSSIDDSYEREVREGKGCFMVNWQGDVERIVAIIALRLLRPDGKVLAQVGVWDGSSAKPNCKLPGKKQKEGDSHVKTFTRLLHGMLAPFSNAVQCTGFEREVSWYESKRLEMTTKYLRTIIHAELTCPEDSIGLKAVEVFAERGRSSRPSQHSGRKSITAMLGGPLPGQLAAAAAASAAAAVWNSGEQLDLYALADQAGEITLMSWLTEEELDYYSGPEGEAALQVIMEQVSVAPSTVEAANALYAAAGEDLWIVEDEDPLPDEPVSAPAPFRQWHS